MHQPVIIMVQDCPNSTRPRGPRGGQRWPSRSESGGTPTPEWSRTSPANGRCRSPAPRWGRSGWTAPAITAGRRSGRPAGTTRSSTTWRAPSRRWCAAGGASGRRPEVIEMKFEGEIDRADWHARYEPDHVHVTLDEYDAADIWREDGGRWLPTLTDFDQDDVPTFETAEEAVEWAKAEWQ